MYVRVYARTRISRISKLKYIIVSLCLYFLLVLVWGVCGGCGFRFFVWRCEAAVRRAAEMQIVLTSVCLELVFNLLYFFGWF